MTAPTKRVPLYNQIRTYITDQIAQGQLLPGDRLPSENELAEHFGVSRITVKGALSSLVKEGTVYRIQGKGSFIADQAQGEPLRYQSPEIRTLKLISLLIPSLKTAYMVNLVKGVENAASSQGYRVIVSLTHESVETECQLLAEAEEMGVAGVIVYPVEGESYNEDILRMTLRGYPIVVIDRYLKGLETNCVCTDHFSGAYAATSHLIEAGHFRIAFLTAPYTGTTSMEDRLEGYRQALADHALLSDPRLVFTRTEPEQIELYLQQNPDVTAVFALNSSLGLKVFAVAERLQLSIPDQLSVIFFDDYEYSTRWTLRPTCILQQEEEIGAQAGRLMLSLVSNPAQERKKIVLPPRLVIGGTTAAPLFRS
ncbi:GntR family transcriptional regulator [Paenibacillus lignilyticus]|uniref:GntR family transcriptional regulator n=1 Tax=Paenibacillus lignilyticus TaxID=1172615 RepID=A0ABS5CL91_9BACL|nr:GntR family transcriptional regulator [Paenibacillus lignilyticus]MBP3966627.1 GntR family transcriptional regulator [Paenibacillus lignilyticus]